MLNLVGAFYNFGLRLSAVGWRVGHGSLFPQNLPKTNLCTRQDTPKDKQAIYIYIYIYSSKNEGQSK